MLTNPQREHFGLRPIEAGWEPVSLKDLVLYYDGDVIRKVICYEHGKQFGYSEFDYDLRTESRARLMPTTPRGKPKPLTPSTSWHTSVSDFRSCAALDGKGRASPFGTYT